LFTRYLYLDLFKERAVDIIQPDVCRAGGLVETRKIAAMAEAHYLPVAPHNARLLGPWRRCTLRFATFKRRYRKPSDDMVCLFVRDAIIGRPEIRGWSLLERPANSGLGVDLTKRYRRASASGRLHGFLGRRLGSATPIDRVRGSGEPFREFARLQSTLKAAFALCCW